MSISPRQAGSLLTLGLAFFMGAGSVQASEALAQKHGCLGCHAKTSQLVGPSYAAVAGKYAGQPDAVATLAGRIRAGGSGVWGQIAMPPQPGVSPADAKKLATWVLSIKK